MNAVRKNAISFSRLGGFFALQQPWLVLRDPEVLKTVMIKDFDHFVDRNPLGTKDREALLMGKDLLSARGTLKIKSEGIPFLKLPHF